MSALDSVAVFEQRARELGVLDSELLVAKANGWKSYAGFAFSCNYVPGAPDDTAFRAMCSTLTASGGSEPEAARLTVLRRVFFESYTLAAAELKAKVERRDEDTPRRMANPERDQRHTDQQARLSGLDLEGELDISYALDDFVNNMFEENQLRYCPWERCTKRLQEIRGISRDPVWKPINGVVTQINISADLKADTSTDLLLGYTFQRRSLAFDRSRLISFSKM